MGGRRAGLAMLWGFFTYFYSVLSEQIQRTQQEAASTRILHNPARDTRHCSCERGDQECQ